jgi:hypothetical protein
MTAHVVSAVRGLAVGLIKAGKVKALGVTGLTRSPLLPNVPTLDEQGVSGYGVTTSFGFVAPAPTPPEIVARLDTALNRIFASGEAEGQARTKGVRPRTADGSRGVRQDHRRRPRDLGANRQGVGRDGEVTGEHRLVRPRGTWLSPRRRDGVCDASECSRSAPAFLGRTRPIAAGRRSMKQPFGAPREEPPRCGAKMASPYKPPNVSFAYANYTCLLREPHFGGIPMLGTRAPRRPQRIRPRRIGIRNRERDRMGQGGFQIYGVALKFCDFDAAGL